MQSRGHAPHRVVSHNPSQAEGCDHLSEGCVGRDDAQSQTGGHTYRETEQSSVNASFHISGVEKMRSFSCFFPSPLLTIKEME